ncbi:MAG: phage terminase small subunit P27 family [Bdellovibrionales bacterium]
MKGRKPNLVALVNPASSETFNAAPLWLTRQAREEWERVAPCLRNRNLFTADTVAMLEHYCLAVGQIRETEALMRRDGRLIVTTKGTIPHPAFRVQCAAMREARLLAAELGLSPHRSAIHGPKGSNKDDAWDTDLLA